jgi:hypothetical protein
MTREDVVNRALEQIGAQTQITSLFPPDGSSTAEAASVLYYGAVDMVLREANWDSARTTAPLATATGGTVPKPWIFEYLYPSDCVQVRQIMSPSFDPNDPRPLRCAVAIDVGLGKKVILASIADALAVYTVRPTEDEWDAILTEAIVRTLASSLAMAMAGRPDFSRTKLEEAIQIAQLGERRFG